jgi:hypothetical protein
MGLLMKPTIQDAAEFANVSESTLYRWLRDDELFRQVYNDARHEAVRGATAKLQFACSTAVDALIELTHKNRPPSIRLQAAKSIIELAYRAVESEDMERRLTELESLAKGRTR